MNALKILRDTAAALTLGGLGVAFVPAAQAISMADYAANALVQVTLTDVRGGSLDTDVTVTYASNVDARSASWAGTTSFAVADPYNSSGQPPRAMGLSDSLTLDHITFGEAGAPTGNAFSEILSSGYISMTNIGSDPVVLVFEISIDPLATGAAVGLSGNPTFANAFANVKIEMFDYLGLNVFKDLNASLASGVASATADLLTTYTVTLAPGDSNDISVLVSTSGGATFVVPEPTTFALFATGLIGFAAYHRRVAA